MSEYHITTTRFTDEECLVNALIASGYTREQIEVHKEPQQLIDYVGRPTRYLDKNGDKANIIIRRQNIGYGSANDLGFKWNTATGTYDAIVSEYDSGSRHWGMNSERFKKLKVDYTDQRAMKSARRQGFKFLGKTIVNGKPVLKFMDTRTGA
jgi:Protein of unknown function (DUF1257)